MWLSLIPIIMSIVSELPKLIGTAEAAFSGKPGSGALKKQFVVEAASQALSVYQAVSPHPLPAEHAQAILSTVSNLTDSTVAVMNMAGLLMGKPTPLAAVAAPIS